MNSNRMERSPRITHLAWGEIEADGLARARDIKLWPGGGREWDWGETGTHHVPGIQVADVLELLEHGTRTVVLTRGMQLVLRTCPETLEYLRTAGVQFHVAETNKAARLYNELTAQGEPVGGLFHSTC
jgi:hypothetical protein